MAGEDRTLRIKDGFSSVLDKYISKLEKAIAKEDEAVTAEDRLTKAMTRAALNDDGIQRWTSALDFAQLKTLEAKDSLNTMIASLERFHSEGGYFMDFEGIMEIITDKLNEMGLAWSDQIGELDAYQQEILLTSHSLDELVQKGVLVQKELSFGEKVRESLQKISDIKPPRLFDDITRRVFAMGLSFVSAAKLISYFRNAASRAPDEVQKKFTKLRESVSNFFAGTTAAAMEKMAVGVERLNQAFNSESGQKFARAMEVIGRLAGDVIAVAFEKLAVTIEWLGDHAEAVIIALAMVTALLAKNALFAAWAHKEQAKAAILANAPLVLMVALAGAVALALVQMGVTAGDIFSGIGGAAMVLYALVYNIVADIWNAIATFAEFLANVFNDPVAAIQNLFYQMALSIYGVLNRVATAIDKIFGTRLADNLTGWKESIDEYGSKIERNEIKIDRMENIDYAEALAQGSAKGRAFGESLSDYSLKMAEAQNIKSIASNTAAIKDAVTDEDITDLVDMAERAFVSQVNLTAQTPVITVNGANTGNTEADRQNLARAIRDILIDQLASGPVTPSPAYFGG